MAQSLIQSLLNLVKDFLAPLESAATNDQARQMLFASLGHTSAISSNQAVLQILKGVAALETSVSSLDESQLNSWDGIQKVLALAGQADTLIDGLKQLANQPGLEQVAAQLAEEIASLLLASWLRRRQKRLFSVLAFLTVIKLRETQALSTPVMQAGAIVRSGYVLDEFDLSRLSDVTSDPADVLISTYLPNGMASGGDAQHSADRLFPYLSLLADAIGLPWDTNFRSTVPPPTAPPLDTTNDFGLDSINLNDDSQYLNSDPQVDAFTPLVPPTPPDSFYATYFPTFSLIPFQSATSQLKIDLKCSSALHPGKNAGLVLGFSGDFNQTLTQGQWKVVFTAQGEIPALLFAPTGVKLIPGATGLTDGSVKAEADFLPPASSSAPAFIFGSTTGTRLELGNAKFIFGIDWTAAAGVTANVGASANGCSIVIAPGDGDGFLSHVLPANGLNAKFDLGVTWSSGGGITFKGAAGLEGDLPVGLSIGGFSIPSIHVLLKAGTTSLSSELSATVSLSIGPLQAVVERIGIVSALNYASSGAPRISDLSFSFKLPSGVGLSINAAGVSGGGFLKHDDTAQEYAGILQLQFNNLALQAFGLITTQVAGHSGYSLLALVDAEFPPVELGWGFTLNGVGGLLAVNRSASTDALHAALKANTLSSILFPTNAITNAPQILSTLDAIFPTAEGRFVFGPMALVGWGTPTVLTAAIAIVIELPEPIRIILIARITARIPSESQSLIRINMDALGILDLSQDSLSLDATLFDSRLIQFTLSGGMALRANWSSSQREFLLAIGGYHPNFTPPAGFPTLQRMTIDMPSGAISKLRLAAYLAVSSNTVQFGATLDVFIGVSGFGLSGHLGFDALFQLSPFHFVADISGQVALTAGGDDLMSVGLDATLSGPAPWNIAGQFKVHIVFFDVTKSFNVSWGDDAPAPQIAPVNVLGLLTTALSDARNWGSALPTGVSPLVSLKDPGTPVIHPLAQLEVHQSVAPLGLSIAQFGSAPVSGPTNFSITGYQVNSSTVSYDPVEDDFAPAQFFNLTDDEKLARPSFETHDAGVRLNGKSLVKCGASVSKTISYETFYVDEPGGALREDTVTPLKTFGIGDLVAVLSFGASGGAAIRIAGNQRYSAPGTPVKIAPQTFTIVDQTTLAASNIVMKGTTYSDAKAALQAAIAQSPSQRAKLQILSVHELSVS